MLDDASVDVREEAALALGAIGSPDAINALIDKLDDVNSDIGPQIARALRRAKDPRMVEALVKKLDDPDNETQRESARTLGEIGDPRAVPPLLQLLQQSDDRKVVNASSEALARLGEVAAIYEILPRLRQTQNPVLKQSLAVAVGDLIGLPGGFYKVLRKENDTYGIEVGRLLDELCKSIRTEANGAFGDKADWIEKLSREVGEAYEEEDYDRCIELLFDMGIGLAALRYGVRFGDESRAFLDELLWRDQGFGIGMWFLAQLRDEVERFDGSTTNALEAQLGVYFLATRGGGAS